MAKMRFDGSGLPTSASVQYWTCGHCPHLHVVLCDEEGEPFASMVVSKAIAQSIIEAGAKITQDGVPGRIYTKPTGH